MSLSKIAVPEKYKHIDFTPPESVAKAAERGLELRKEQTGDKAGLTPEEASKEGIGSGVQRATNLKNRTNVSPEVIGQMVGFFARHGENIAKARKLKTREEQIKSNMYVSDLLWGGAPGERWANKVKKQMEAADEKEKNKSASRIASHVVRRLLAENLPRIARVNPKFAYDLYRQEDLNRGNNSAREDFPQTDSRTQKMLDRLEEKIDTLSDEIERLQDQGVDHSALYRRREKLIRERDQIVRFRRDTLGFGEG